jgi:hypothetical protein
MNGFWNRSIFDHRASWTKMFLASVVVAAWQSKPAEASPIWSARQSALSQWRAFVSAGPSLWSSVHAPPITMGVRFAMLRGLGSANPTSDPFVEYLEWRRNRAPARFDHWHPRLGPWLSHLLPPLVPQPQTVNPKPPGTNPKPPSNPPPQVNPPSVPEPGTWAIALMLLGSGVWWRSRSRPASVSSAG